LIFCGVFSKAGGRRSKDVQQNQHQLYNLHSFSKRNPQDLPLKSYLFLRMATTTVENKGNPICVENFENQSFFRLQTTDFLLLLCTPTTTIYKYHHATP
jgi:hypothetical protein